MWIKSGFCCQKIMDGCRDGFAYANNNCQYLCDAKISKEFSSVFV